MSTNVSYDEEGDMVNNVVPCVGDECQFWVKVFIHGFGIKECCCHALNIGLTSGCIELQR